MGQYFKAVNFDKREYVCPWCIGGLAKLWEWAANPWGAIFVMLLRKSTGSGGGDYNAGPAQVISLDQCSEPGALVEMIRAGVAREGQPISLPPDSTVGRWAGDRVALVGDYDDSGLWNELPSYRNISAEVVRDWNAFMDIPENQLKHNADCTCSVSFLQACMNIFWGAGIVGCRGSSLRRTADEDEKASGRTWGSGEQPATVRAVASAS